MSVCIGTLKDGVAWVSRVLSTLAADLVCVLVFASTAASGKHRELSAELLLLLIVTWW